MRSGGVQALRPRFRKEPPAHENRLSRRYCERWILGEASTDASSVISVPVRVLLGFP